MKSPLLPAWTLVVLFSAVPATSLAQDKDDYARMDPAKQGFKAFEPRKDPKTGFLLGGKNGTDLLPRLTETNGRTIADLEKDMRPGNFSTAGFLGKDEKLLEVL